MKKLSILSITTLAGFLVFAGTLFPQSVFAVDVLNNGDTAVCQQAGASDSPTCKDAASGKSGNPLLGPEGAVTKGIQIFVAIVGIVAIVALLINATRLIIGGSDPSAVGSARNGILYAVIGLVVVASAQAIVSFVLKKL